MSDGATVQIVKVQQQKVVLDSKTLKNVLQEAKVFQNGVAVVSICGQCGKGKSYLANCFLQYLRRNGFESEDVSTWLRDVTWNSVPDDTPGIYLYKNIFKINDIAVILLQAQGAFTNDDGRNHLMQIFTLATLLSNVQIFNLRSHLHGDDVFFVKDLIEYVSRTSANLGLRGILDMKLCFLVRDWSYPRDNGYGFEGGEKYFEHATRNSRSEGSTEAMYLNTSLRQHFKTTSCFLMPHPGMKVRSKKSVKVSDLDSEFKSHLRGFIEYIFQYKELLTSKFGSGRTNGKLLLEFAEKCLKEMSKTGSGATAVTKNVARRAISTFVGNAKSRVPAIPEKKIRAPTEKREKKYLQAQKITEHKAFRIIEVENQRLTLNTNLFDQILSQPEIGNKPIALVSIAGAFRMGKSFILNFFLRYMKNKGYLQDGDSWLGGNDAPLTEGFEWAKGTTRHTEGIVLYSQPYLISTERYGEVAVLFMDTQGLFDPNTNKQTNLMIFAFNAIISSVQILNVSKNIQENDLDMLQFFTEFARTVKSARGTAEFLQSLKFLVRDWQFEDDFAFGCDGGEKYLDDYLKTNKVSKELNSVREYITTSYSDVSCYLMPHPGLQLVRLKHGTGCLKDLDCMFVEHLTPLMKSVLHPNNLVIKEFNGEPLKARGLLASAIKCADAFESGGLPKVSGMMEILADATNNEIRRDCLDTYTRLMEERFTSNLSQDGLKKIHEEAKKEAIEKHYSKPAFGGYRRQNESKDHVKKEIDDALPKFLAKQNHSETEHKYEISNNHISAVENYKNMMQKVTKVPLAPEKFEAVQEECWHLVKDKIKMWDEGSQDTLVKKTMQNMENEKENLYSIYKRHNNSKYEANIESLDNLDCYDPESPSEEKASANSEPMTQAIERVLQESMKKNPNDDEMSRRNLYELAVDDYDKSNYNASFTQYLNQLERRMTAQNKKLPMKPDKNLKVKVKMRKLVAYRLECFENDHAQLADLCVDNRIFESLVKRGKADAEEKFDIAAVNIVGSTYPQSKNLIRSFKQELVQGLDDRIEVMKKENLRNLGHFKLARDEMEKRVIREYHTDMDIILDSGYIPKKKLIEKHEEIRDHLSADIDANRLPFYAEEGKTKSEDQAFCTFKNGVLKKIDKLFEEKKARNKRNHGIIVKALSNFLNR